jgi:hypothetical protein
MTPGSTAYLEAKADGDNSMPLKREVSEGVYGTVPQDPRDTARATLLKAQLPAINGHPPATTPNSWDRRYTTDGRKPSEPSGWWAVRNDLTQGSERAAYVALTRLNRRERGIAYGTRVLRRRSLHSSRGSNAPPRRAGKPLTGQREAGVHDATRRGRYARCVTPKRS